jgi:Outer membrane efflux protein
LATCLNSKSWENPIEIRSNFHFCNARFTNKRFSPLQRILFYRKFELFTQNPSSKSLPFVKKIVFVSCCLFLASAHCQTATIKVEGVTLKPITLRDYLSQVQQSNAFLSTKKLAVESSVAMEESMGAANINPSFTLSRGSYYASKPSATYTPQANTYSLSGTIEAPGKQQARKDYAATEVSRSKFDMQVSTKAIEGDAAFAFIDALRVKLIWQALQSANEKIQAINDKESAAAIENQTAIQKNLSNDFKYFALGMNAFVGQGIGQLFDPRGSVDVPTRDFKPADYSATALARRNDIVSLEAALKVAQSNLNLTEKNRRVDLSPSVWYSETKDYTYAAGTSSETAYNKSGTWGFSLSIPIPLANLYDGPLVQANNNRTQVELYLNDAKSRAVIEVNQLLMQYASAKTKLEDVRAYREEGLKDKSRSTKNMVSQREREVDLIDAQTNHAKALIQVLRAIGEYSLPNFN